MVNNVYNLNYYTLYNNVYCILCNVHHDALCNYSV